MCVKAGARGFWSSIEQQQPESTPGSLGLYAMGVTGLAAAYGTRGGGVGGGGGGMRHVSGAHGGDSIFHRLHPSSALGCPVDLASSTAIRMYNVTSVLVGGFYAI